ncbi:uncharacterized protein LOC142590425 [Dermacentor variabilis]|uniref:uncharacterized protein LOC142590425 n=1 Tax=Dermacentor variabilis TaxID=34621 RepID=UPI003F5CAB46
MALAKLYRAVTKMKQPFRFLAHLSFCGLISGFLFVLTGVLLLAFFGSNIREDEVIKRIPTWIGIIATGSGIMFLFVGVTLTILLCKLFNQQAAREGDNMHIQRFPSQPGLYPVQATNCDASGDAQDTAETEKLT